MHLMIRRSSVIKKLLHFIILLVISGPLVRQSFHWTPPVSWFFNKRQKLNVSSANMQEFMYMQMEKEVLYMGVPLQHLFLFLVNKKKLLGPWKTNHTLLFVQSYRSWTIVAHYEQTDPLAGFPWYASTFCSHDHIHIYTPLLYMLLLMYNILPFFLFRFYSFQVPCFKFQLPLLYWHTFSLAPFPLAYLSCMCSLIGILVWLGLVVHTHWVPSPLMIQVGRGDNLKRKMLSLFHKVLCLLHQ